jgi:hypothetical protein
MRSPRTLPVIALVALTFVVPLRASGPTVAHASRCPKYSSPKRTGQVNISGINEISGVETSTRFHGLWMEEDSGNPANLYATRDNGKTVATIPVRNASNHDWEDMSLSGNRIWMGDIGDNAKKRSSIQVYWFKQPNPSVNSVRANHMDLRYSDHAHNAEAMFVDYTRRALYIVTKETSGGVGYVFRADLSHLHGGASRTLQKIGSVPLGTVTAADSGQLGIIVKNYTQGLLYRWTGGRNVRKTLNTKPCVVNVAGGESIAFGRASRRLFSVPEGHTPPVLLSRET